MRTRSACCSAVDAASHVAVVALRRKHVAGAAPVRGPVAMVRSDDCTLRTHPHAPHVQGARRR